MTDSHPDGRFDGGLHTYLAPADLAEARSRLDRLVDERCLRLGVDRDDPGVVVELARRPLVDQVDQVTVDTAVVVADLVLWRWEQQVLDVLAELIGPRTALVFLEPTADIGWRHQVHRLSRVFRRDIPAALRAAGLTVSTVDRFSIGPAGIRSYVWGQAEHIQAWPASGSEPTSARS